MHSLESYLHELHAIHVSGAGVKETSYYPALKNLLDAVGHDLRPRVQCIIHLSSKGAGIPDGGLFTADQLKRGPEDPLAGQLPARAVIEVKSAREEVRATAESEQVAKYLARYGLALVTNLRDFQLVRAARSGRPELLEGYRLADSETAFWQGAASARRMTEVHGEALVEFLKRVMLASAPLARPEDVAWFLASYARDAKARVERADAPALAVIRAALEEALGLAFEGKKGDHFFRSTLVQTLFYGVFSAWVLWHADDPDRDDRFDWRLSAYYLRLPVMQVLFEQVGDPSKLRSLDLVEVLDWTGAALGRVDRAVFFASFEREHAVQYFYEPFLKAFDPELRKELGVWYTPPEIVDYQTARVDAVLKSELGIPDGLADERVVILDACAGTGAYIVAALRRIAATLEARGEGALLGSAVKRAAMTRVFGFEILPAPYVVAHLQVGLLLQQLYAPLGEGERAGIYLTNALTGWDERGSAAPRLPGFPELEAERDAATRVKREAPILVVLGNPPYNGFAGAAVGEERDLSTAYRTTKRAPAPQGQGLNELYVRFFRAAERCITEHTGRGLVCFISNYSWLDGLSFTGMRERFMEVFDEVWIDNLHGDRTISEYAPDGRTSETVFAMVGHSPGIKVGTAITLMVAKGGSHDQTEIWYRDWDQARAADRRAALVQSLDDHDRQQTYRLLDPIAELGFPLKPRRMSISYLTWPKLPELFPTSFPGVKTSRDDVVVDIDHHRLQARMRQYFDPSVSHELMRRIAPGAMESTARFDAVATRDYLLKRGILENRFIRYCYRPFDIRWLYWEPETKLLDEKRSEYVANTFDGNLWIVSQQRPRRDWSCPQVIQSLGCLDLMDRSASCIPRLLAHATDIFSTHIGAGPRLNLSEAARAYLASLTNPATSSDVDICPLADALFYHAIANLHAPAYRAESAGALHQDWPRIPLPADRERLLASAALGRRIAALLDTEAPVPGVTSGDIEPALRSVAVVAQTNPGPLDLAVTAGWGHGGKGGVTMPGKGKLVQREPAGAEIEAGFGDVTFDVYLNDRTYWRNIPEPVWTYTIGGYQVIKKWLSYREQKLLGRSLKDDEVREVRDMARRIAVIVRLESALDANYAAVKDRVWEWPTPAKRA